MEDYYHKYNKYTVFVLNERRRYSGVVTMISYKLRIRGSNEDNNAKSKIQMIQAAVQQSKFEENIE